MDSVKTSQQVGTSLKIMRHHCIQVSNEISIVAQEREH